MKKIMKYHLDKWITKLNEVIVDMEDMYAIYGAKPLISKAESIVKDMNELYDNIENKVEVL